MPPCPGIRCCTSIDNVGWGMANVIVVGGGPTGLTAAMKFAGAGAAVTVLERDSAPMPDSPTDAWERWERRAVPQFRQIHYLQPGGRWALEEHLPSVIDELRGVGAIELHADVIFCAPDPAPNPDPKYATLTTSRRPVLELAFARAAAKTPCVEIRRGAVVESLVTGPEVVPGVPHIVGVRLAGGETLSADLVVDASGRRSAIGQMIVDAGGREMRTESTEVGFVYTTRFYRGELPEYRGEMLTPLGSISALTIHGDDNIWGATLYNHPADKALRNLRDPAVFERVYRLLPDHAHWVDGEPITEPTSMTSTSNTIREFVADGVPVATGLVPLGDAFAFTNPSIGRGIAIGIIHTVDVVDAIAPVLDDAAAISTAWSTATDRRARPFIRATIDYDRVRGPDIEAAMEGRIHQHTDPAALGFIATNNARHRDQFVYENFRDIATLKATTAEVLARKGVFERVIEFGAEAWTPVQPTRDQLLAAVT
ncbi:MAG: FAD-dependent monooxygenase [Acidimicrobiales bacterium]